MADIFQINTGVQIFHSVGIIGIPITGVGIVEQNPPIINITTIQNLYTGIDGFHFGIPPSG